MTSAAPGARWLAPAVLTIEGVMALLVVPVVAVSDRARPGRDAGLVAAVALLLLIGAGVARRTTVVGWLGQVALVATGLLHPVMWFLGPLFALMWAGSLRLMRKRPYTLPKGEINGRRDRGAE